MSTGLQLYFDFIVFVLGAAIGSFANVCIYRMPRELSIVTPPSRCSQCGKNIAWYDNIPLVSYLLLRGRCRWCGAQFSCRYLLVECLTGALWLAAWLQYRDTGNYTMIIAYWILIALLVIGTFIDFEFYIIPNEITFGGVIIGFVFSVLAPALHHAGSRPQAALQSLIGILVGGVTLYLVAEIGKLIFGRLKLPLPPETVVRIADNKLQIDNEDMPWLEIFSRTSDRIRFLARTLKFQGTTYENVNVTVSETLLEFNGTSHALAEIGPVEFSTELLIIPREAMGLGDAKLLAAIGAFLGWQAALLTVFWSSVIGGLVSVILIISRKKDWQSRIPYGPYIALGALLWIYFGRQLVDWYVNLIKG